MPLHKLYTKASREELITDICDHLHEGGLPALQTFGEYAKTTGLYHFAIKDPTYLPKEPFLFVTELFGNEECLPSGKTGHFGVSRLQYHGDFNGLQRIIQQLITPGLSLPAHLVIAEKKTLTDRQRQRFDDAFTYLAGCLRFDVPANRLHVADTELFSHTYFPL